MKSFNGEAVFTGSFKEMTHQIDKQPVSPTRDFTKMPNSVMRNVAAAGLFKGKSKIIYDYLWTHSRGSIQQTRTVKKTMSEIKKGCGIGAMSTVRAGLNYLERIGLVKKTSLIGEATGNIYEVFDPQEIGLGGPAKLDQLVQLDQLDQKVVELVEPVFDLTDLTQTDVNNTDNESLRPSYKTNIIDDNAAFSSLNDRLNAACEKLTGKKASVRDVEKWGNLANILIRELETAAQSSGRVSNVPAFLTEVLRRKLLNQQAPKTFRSKPDTVGKAEIGEYEIKALDEQGREAALIHLQEFAGTECLDDFRKWYMPEDWEWLIKELKVK